MKLHGRRARRNFIVFITSILLITAAAAIMTACLSGGDLPAAVNVPGADASPSGTATASAKPASDRPTDKESVVNTDKIYPNIYINDMNVGGLTKAEALLKLTQKPQEELGGRLITVVSGQKRVTFTFADFDVRYSFEQAVNAAYDYARQGDLNTRYNMITNLEKKPYKIDYAPVYTFDTGFVTAKIEELAEEVYVKPVNATVKRAGGEFVFSGEETGIKMNVESTVDKVRQLILSGEGGEAEAALETVLPDVREADLRKANSVLGSFSTKFSGAATIGRNVNIANAVNKINGWVLAPGDVFSTNAAFGPSTEANGYVNAPTYVSGRLVDDLGGGVCQVSSTLYNALLYAELPIVERQNHSMKVGYTDYGFDATLAGDYIDLKFRNDTAYPVFIEAGMTDGKVSVSIYGYETRSSGRTLSFRNELQETIEPDEDIVTMDPELPLGERVVDKPAITGFVYAVYKTVYRDGAEASTERVNTSRYRAYAAEVREGTGEAAPPSDPTAPPEATGGDNQGQGGDSQGNVNPGGEGQGGEQQGQGGDAPDENGDFTPLNPGDSLIITYPSSIVD